MITKASHYVVVEVERKEGAAGGRPAAVFGRR
jgi:hypothetical protein